MRVSSLIITALALGLFQVSLLSYFSVFGVKPDLLLAIVVIAGFLLEPRWALFFGVLAGIFKDAFGLSPFGFNIILFACWGYFVNKLSRRISIEDNIAAAILLFLIALLQNIASGLAVIYSGGFVPFGIFLRVVFLGSLYTALTLPLILKIARIKI